MKQTISTQINLANIEQVLTLLEEIPARISALSSDRSAKALNQLLRTGERSFAEILAHLLHCEAISAESIYLALMVKEPLIAKIHPERNFGKLLRYDRHPIPDLLAYFKFRRTALLGVLKELTIKQGSRTIREEGKQREESVYWRARGQALHELEHMLEIEQGEIIEQPRKENKI